MNCSNRASAPFVTVTLEIPQGWQGVFIQLARDFCGPAVRIVPPPVDLGSKRYREVAHELLADCSTSFALRRRIAEDDSRDALEALTDAQVLHALHARRSQSWCQGEHLALLERLLHPRWWDYRLLELHPPPALAQRRPGAAKGRGSAHCP